MYSCVPTLVTGFFLGVAYNIPFLCALQYFPAHSYLIKTALYLSDSAGAFYFAYFTYDFLDIDDYLEETPPKVPSLNDNYYPREIVKDVPDLLRYLGLNLLVIGCLGSLVLKPKFNFVEKDWSALRKKGQTLLRDRKSVGMAKRKEKAPFRDLKHTLVSPMSNALFQIMMYTSVLGRYYLYAFKTSSLKLGYDDYYLTIAGGFGIVVMSLGKIGGLLAFKAIPFKISMRRIFIVQIVLEFTGGNSSWINVVVFPIDNVCTGNDTFVV